MNEEGHALLHTLSPDQQARLKKAVLDYYDERPDRADAILRGEDFTEEEIALLVERVAQYR
jgi:hypothetical protein